MKLSQSLSACAGHGGADASSYYGLWSRPAHAPALIVMMQGIGTGCGMDRRRDHTDSARRVRSPRGNPLEMQRASLEALRAPCEDAGVDLAAVPCASLGEWASH